MIYELGWIKLHRNILNWEWFKEPETLQFFIYCLSKANFKEKKWQGITINRGEFVTGRTAISAETGLSERQIRTCIARLKSTSNLTVKTTNKYSIITVCNYDTYQESETKIDQQNDQQNDNQTTSKRPANDQQTTTTKNDNNNKNDNNDKNDIKEITTTEFKKPVKAKPFLSISECKAIIKDFFQDEDILELLYEWIDIRNYNKKPLTLRAIKEGCTKLQGWSKDECLESIKSTNNAGWMGFFKPKVETQQKIGGYKTKSDEINDKWKKIAEEDRVRERQGLLTENIFEMKNFKQIGVK